MLVLAVYLELPSELLNMLCTGLNQTNCTWTCFTCTLVSFKIFLHMTLKPEVRITRVQQMVHPLQIHVPNTQEQGSLHEPKSIDFCIKGRTAGLKDCTSSICSMLPNCPGNAPTTYSPTNKCYHFKHFCSIVHHRKIPKGLEDKCMLKSMSFLPICPFKNNSERFHRKLLYLSGSTSGHSESREILKLQDLGPCAFYKTISTALNHI